MQYNGKQVAEMLGKQPITIRKISEQFGVGVKVGRDWIYTDADVETLRNWRKPGRPKAQKPAK